jgi:ATP-dependent DNA helicase PIF1
MTKDIILEKLYQKQNIFLTGGAGVGKTTLTREIIAAYLSEAKKVARLASTGMAATLLEGHTLHSFFDLGICDSVEALEVRGKLNLKKKVKKLIQSMDIIIIDEISMVSSELLEMIRFRILQAEFKGVLLVVGDFLQLPPVVRGSNEVHFAFESSSWDQFNFEVITLTKVHRTDDEDFIAVLDAVRFGEVNEAEHYYLHHLIQPLPEDLKEFTLLFGKNASAHQHNIEQLAFIDEPTHSYETQIVKHNKKITDKEVERFLSDSRLEKTMQLKVGSPVLFTRNSWNYFNGERGEVVKLEPEAAYVLKKDSSGESKVVKLERVAISKTSWQEKLNEVGKLEMQEIDLITLHQFPLQLAFAITIHKSQGMSISDLVINTHEIFAPSQFYVALSRATTPTRLIMMQPHVNWKHLAFVNEKAVKFVKDYS